jgi:hypothetical protein
MEWTFLFVHGNVRIEQIRFVAAPHELLSRKHLRSLGHGDEDEEIRQPFRAPKTWGRSIPGAKTARMKYELPRLSTL